MDDGGTALDLQRHLRAFGGTDELLDDGDLARVTRQRVVRRHLDGRTLDRDRHGRGRRERRRAERVPVRSRRQASRSTVHCVPVGIPLIVWNEPAFTDTSPVVRRVAHVVNRERARVALRPTRQRLRQLSTSLCHASSSCRSRSRPSDPSSRSRSTQAYRWACRTCTPSEPTAGRLATPCTGAGRDPADRLERAGIHRHIAGVRLVTGVVDRERTRVAGRPTRQRLRQLQRARVTRQRVVRRHLDRRALDRDRHGRGRRERRRAERVARRSRRRRLARPCTGCPSGSR